jgi:CheY-like chemotaxis protein
MDKHILIVDDSEMIRDLIKILLSEYGYIVSMAANGRHAWDMIKINSFDCVVLDLNMPEMDGVQVLEHIRADPKTKDLPVVVVTANDYAERQREAISAGANEVITKPFNNKELILAISQLAG